MLRYPAVVKSPRILPFPDQDNRTLKDIGRVIALETKKEWTDVCTDVLEKNPKCLFLFDRFAWSVKKAFGADYCIALNPSMILCYHPRCRRNSLGPHKLRNICKLKEYREHLETHTDDIGCSMQLRFGEVDRNPFATTEELDELAPAPATFTLCEDVNLLNTMYFIGLYGIERILHQYGDQSVDEMTVRPQNPTYICHWKDLLVSSDIITSSSLSFQEDDALVSTILRYPDPIPDWSLWGTIELYAIKMYTSLSAATLNLFRGITFNRLTTKPEALPDVKEFAKSMNHPSLSVTQTANCLPDLKYENKTLHTSEILFHIKLLDKSNESFRFDFGTQVTRFPVTGGIDEQEINPGVFIIDGELCGLQKKMTAEDVRRVGIDSLGEYISTENPYVISVRENRLTDFAGKFCSNAVASFETHSLSSFECSRDLDEMITFSISCESCLKAGIVCKYTKINEQCSSCVENGERCVSLSVFHILWDMGSSHKKTAKENPFNLHTSSCQTDQMWSPKHYTIGFGGLHIAKALVNTMRNHVLQYDGEYFGIDILISLRWVCELLQKIKTAVFVGKDRQSDLLSYLTVCRVVQEALKKQKNYLVQRVPEKYMPYKKNASSQKKIVYPVDVCANVNGEVFLLDAGAACIHVVDRSTVAALYVIGKYNTPNLENYPVTGKNMVQNIRFSNSLLDISIDAEDNLYVTDSSRKEVIVIRNCARAKKSIKTQFRVMKVKGLLSSALSSHDNTLYVLRQKKKSGQHVQLMSFDLKKNKNQVSLEYIVLLKMRPSFSIKKLFPAPFDRCFGGMDDENDLKLVCYNAKSKGKVSEFNIEARTESKPYIHTDGSLITTTKTGLDVHQLIFDRKGTVTKFVVSHELEGATSSVCMNGKVVSVAVVNQNSYCLLQLGPLNFSVNYANAVLQLYDAIGYVPPRGDRAERLTRRNIAYSESISKGKESVKLLSDMQKQAENLNPGRSSFQGADGMPFTDTIHSYEATVESWEVNQQRVELMKEGSSAFIHAPAITSEKNVEHSFGYASQKGQGHNMTMQEYIIAKRRFGVDFQLRMCKMPFCQHTKEKIKDKGYQQIEGDRCKITSRELLEIFTFTERENIRKNKPEVPENDRHLLQKAFLIAKSVPRQTNRAKWRERSGFAPNLLLDKSTPGMLHSNDLVCCRSVTDSLMFLIVQEDVLLSNSDVKVSVRFPDGTISFDISSDKLVVDKEQIMALPMQLYQVIDGEVKLADAVSADFELLSSNQVTDLSEEEWAVLTDTSGVPNEDLSETGKKRKGTVNAGGKKKKKNLLVTLVWS